MSRVQLPRAQNVNGRYVRGARITSVTIADSGTAHPVYNAAVGGSQVSYPITSGAEGEFQAYAEPATIDIYFNDDDDTIDNPQRTELVSGFDASVALDIIQDGLADLPFYNAEDFGATGDGSTDDTNALTDAVDAVKATGGLLFIPAGTYIISDTIEIGFPDQTKRYQIRGAGSSNGNGSMAATTLRYTAGAGSDPMLHGDGLNGVEISHMNWEYSASGFDGNLVEIANGIAGDPTNWHVHHVSSRSPGPATALSILNLHKCIIGQVTEFRFADAINPLRIDPDGYCVNVTIGPGTFNDAEDAMIVIGSGDCENLTIKQVAFEAGTNTPAVRGMRSDLDGPGNSCGCYNLVYRENWHGDASAACDWVKSVNGINTSWPNLVIGNGFHTCVDGTPWSFEGNGIGVWVFLANGFQDCNSAFGDCTAGSSPLHLVIGAGNTLSSTDFGWWTTAPPTWNIAEGSVLGATTYPLTLNTNDSRTVAITGTGSGDLSTTNLGSVDLILGLANAVQTSVGVPAIYRQTALNDLIIQGSTTSNADEITMVGGTAAASKFRMSGVGIGFNGTGPTAKPTVTGSKGGNAALTSLLSALNSIGLLTDSSS